MLPWDLDRGLWKAFHYYDSSSVRTAAETFRCHTAATNSLVVSLETGIIFLSLKKMVEGCFNNQVQCVLCSQKAHVIQPHWLTAERRLKGVVGMHWLKGSLRTYFYGTVLVCLLSVFGNPDDRRSSALTSIYQLHGNAQAWQENRDKPPRGREQAPLPVWKRSSLGYRQCPCGRHRAQCARLTPGRYRDDPCHQHKRCAFDEIKTRFCNSVGKINPGLLWEGKSCKNTALENTVFCQSTFAGSRKL